MSADLLQRADSILDEAESSLNGFVIALKHKLCPAARELLEHVHGHLVEAHELLETLDDAPEVMVLRYTEITSGLRGAIAKFKRSC